jgi:hypothetical protein
LIVAVDHFVRADTLFRWTHRELTDGVESSTDRLVGVLATIATQTSPAEQAAHRLTNITWLTQMHVAIVATILLLAASAWLATLTKKPTETWMRDYLGFVATVVLIETAVLLANPWVSLVVVISCTAWQTARLLKRIEDSACPEPGTSEAYFWSLLPERLRQVSRTEPFAKKPSAFSLWAGAFTLTSGFVIAAGLVPPLDFATPLEFNETLGSLLVARFTLTIIVFGAFIIAQFVDAVRTVASRDSLPLTISDEVHDTISPFFPAERPPKFAHNFQPLLQVFIIFFHALVAIRVWAAAVFREFWESVLAVARYRALLWSALFNTLPRLLGFVLIGVAAFRLSPFLIALLEVKLEVATRLEELRLLSVCLAYFAVIIGGIFLVSWTLVPNARERFHDFYGGILGSFLAACLCVGIVFLGFQKAGTFDSLSGFNQLGAFSIVLFVLAGLTGTTRVYMRRKRGAPRKEESAQITTLSPTIEGLPRADP